MLFCRDLLLWTVCSEKIGVKATHEWQKIRSEKLSQLADQAENNGIAYVSLLGRCFGNTRVPESVIDALFATASSHQAVTFLAFLSEQEMGMLGYRNDIPSNFVLLKTGDTYSDEIIHVSAAADAAVIKVNNVLSITVKENEEGGYVLYGVEETPVPVLRFEPTGFADADQAYGYSVFEWNENGICSYEETRSQAFQYRTIEVERSSKESSEELMKRIMEAVEGCPFETVLRLVVTGKSDLTKPLPITEIVSRLQTKVFHASVYDHTVMDIDPSSFENDISLRSEFVRLTLKDDSLSEAERNRILWSGWNVLRRKGVPEE